ncbi:MAG: 5'/3'-nucleotidase SurE [Treponema sp.]
MNILITNDDGFEASGIRTLAKRMAKDHSVFIVAPSGNRSAASHIISMHKNLEIKTIEPNVWSCSGYPADCVVTALNSPLLPVKPDCILSGINAGANMGTDIIYSGTCAAARQGVLDGIPSVAFSLYDPDDAYEHYGSLADFAAKNLKTLISLSAVENGGCFVNVNALSIPAYKGAKIASSLCVRQYGDIIKLSQKDDGYDSFFHGGIPYTAKAKNSDNDICMDGFVSVSLVQASPVQADCKSAEKITFTL